MQRKKLVVGITASVSTILIKGQIKYFSEKGYETYLLAPQDERTIKFCEEEGCILLPVKIKRDISILSDLLSLFQVIIHFVKIKPDVINLGTPKISLVGMIAGKLTGVQKKVYTCRGFRFEHETGLKKQILIQMEKIAGALANNIICISPSVKELAMKLNVFSPDKTMVIGQGSSNGIDLNFFNHSTIDKQEVFRLKKKLNIENNFIYGFVGRLVDRKGVVEIYNAFSDLYKSNPNLRFVFVGGVELEQIADKNLIQNIENHPGFIYVGPQLNVPLYLTIMDVFVLPAWWEGFGNVLIQAAAMGVPVISTEATGCVDAVSNGFNGILVKPKSVVELKQAMELLFNDGNLRDQYGKNGIIWAKNFDRNIIWNELNNIYQS